MIIAICQSYTHQNNHIMISQRAVFSLKGTNINLPNRYKIRKFRTGKIKSDKPDYQEAEDQLPVMIQAKETFPLRVPLDLPRHAVTNSHENTATDSPQYPSPVIPSSTSKITIKIKCVQEALSVSNPKLICEKDNHTSILKRGRDHYSSMRHKRCTCGDCPECLKDFAYFLHLFSDDQSLPDISAKSWCVWKKKNGKYFHYYGKRIHKVREIASLSKMITAITAFDFLNKYNLDPALVFYKVKKTSVMIGGTTAKLQQGQICSLLQLFYGMMLPSGNDAAIAMSEAIGLLAFLKYRNKQVNPQSDDWYEPYRQKNYAYMFISMMNQRCQKLGTLDTKFFNSHGNDAYDQLKNISTCNQIAKIASEFMTYNLLKDICKTSTYGPYENTNKLLEDGFDGIKTGITDTAGPCLAASYKDFIIVVLHSKSMNERWMEVKKLVKWMIRKG